MSDTEAISLPQAKEQQKTTVGNYFVSNYPPFAYWKPENATDALAVIESQPKPETDLGLYVHIPFCRKRCHFCYYKVYTDKNKDEIRSYLDAVLGELRQYVEMPYFRGRKPTFVYFGGGTPSYLSPAQLEYLFNGLKELMPWTDAKEVAFECEPGTLTGPKLDVLKNLGVTRLSLGIENLDDHILEINGRAHRTKEIDKCYPHAKSLGFDQINIDLISGMVEETEENWRECVRKTIEMDPECVTIYQMEVPYNTTIYREMKDSGKLVAPVADWPTKRRWVKYAFDELQKAGYTISSAYTAVKNPDRVRFEYRDRLWEGADLLSLGVASFGHVGGVHYQNEKDFGPYIERVNLGQLPIWRALKTTEEERLVRELILRMKLGRISKNYYRDKFGVDVEEKFAEAFGAIRDEGVTIEGDDIVLTRDALLEIDRLSHEFFLPQHRGDRYV